MTNTDGATELREEIRRRYAEAALTVADGGTGSCGSGSCCAEPATDARFGEALYDADQLAELPHTAATSSLGCGNPTLVAELQEGDTVLDLGSGGGTDAILSAHRVGADGVVYGLDMTDEMLALARHNVETAGIRNVHLLRGAIEAVPLPADSVDVVISNCVVNLSTDKAAALTEIARVLVPGGRVGISDVVAEDRLSTEDRAERGGWVGCIAGALSVGEYRAGLVAVGLVDVEIELTHEVADGMHGAIVRARKPEGARRVLPLTGQTAEAGCC